MHDLKGFVSAMYVAPMCVSEGVWKVKQKYEIDDFFKKN